MQLDILVRAGFNLGVDLLHHGEDIDNALLGNAVGITRLDHATTTAKERKRQLTVR